ncbi:MAG TPA: formylmethanofuran dehydrogenase, partial [Burkholderiaceae bacterium]|nr:formylmethanofuran dehydrogenase [Burkholderiaceae bacterium]
MPSPDPAFVTLAEQLHAARYAVLVWEAGVLPAHGALLVEALNRIVASLNLTTRAATFSLGGSDGAYTINNVFTWLSGLPLRTRVQQSSVQHEPLRFDTQSLLSDHAVDGLLWVASFDPTRVPPATDLPCVVLGPPAMSTRLRDTGMLDRCIFLPVATPGLNAPGHLFRTDGGIVVPLVPAGPTSLPTVAEVLMRIDQRVAATTTREAS